MLPRPSNTGILISAVLVGLLALGANWYMRLGPEFFLRFLPTVTTSDDANNMPDVPTKHVAKETEIPVLITAEAHECVTKLEKNETRVKAIFDKWKEERTFDEPELAYLPQIVAESEKLYGVVALDAEATTEEKSVSRKYLLAITFRAAQIFQDELQDSFWKISDEIVKNGMNDLDTARAEVLRIIMKTNFRNPDEERLLGDVHGFMQTYSSVTAGIELHLLLAKDLFRSGHFELARKVLQMGIDTYEGTRGHVRLLNEMIRQQG